MKATQALSGLCAEPGPLDPIPVSLQIPPWVYGSRALSCHYRAQPFLTKPTPTRTWLVYREHHTARRRGPFLDTTMSRANVLTLSQSPRVRTDARGESVCRSPTDGRRPFTEAVAALDLCWPKHEELSPLAVVPPQRQLNHYAMASAGRTLMGPPEQPPTEEAHRVATQPPPITLLWPGAEPS